ncbi:MAG: twin-arginine translocation signal domain-containing protein [Xanthobacteraceae bacterium]
MSQDQFGKPTRRAFLGTATVATAASLTAPVVGEAQGTGTDSPVGATKLAQADAGVSAQLASRAKAGDWTKPAAMAIPKEGYFELEQGRYGPIFPKTPANYGFTLIAKIKPGREETIRAYGKTIENAIAGNPSALAPLKLHYLRWVLFNVGGETYFMYQGIFDTDFDKYTEDAVALFTSLGVNTVFENLQGFPMDWKTNVPAFVKFVREHQCPSFLEYGEYPFVSADEIKKALKVKASLSSMLDQMQ